MTWKWAALSLALLPQHLPAQQSNLRLRIDAGEAEAALAVLDARAATGQVPESLWVRLEQSEGYVRLSERETAMGRAQPPAEFRAFLSQDSLLPRREALRRTLMAWRTLPVEDAGARALAYLPPGTPLEATVYLLIKPRANSFVFDLQGRPSIMLYLDTEVTPPAFANRVAHELHHIGLGAACRSFPDTSYADTSQAATAVRSWLTAFGEGLAMLAAAGGPSVHPHRDSPAADRERWDGEFALAEGQIKEVEQFFLDVLDRKLTDEAGITERGMKFFGVQGPWYTLGYRMWSTVERKMGRERVIADACRPARLLLDYNAAVATDRDAPRWSDRFTARLPALLKAR